MRVSVPVDVEVAPAVLEERAEADVVVTGGARAVWWHRSSSGAPAPAFIADGLPVLAQQVEFREIGRVEDGL